MLVFAATSIQDVATARPPADGDQAQAVLHTLTPLGAELLASSLHRDLDARYG